MAVRKDNGQGQIYYDETKEYWYAEIQWTLSPEKKILRKSKAAVKKKLDDFRKQLLLAGSEVGEQSVLFKDFAENWLNY